MQRKPGSHPRSSVSHLMLILILFAIVLIVAGGLFSCAFQPVVATRGTMLFLPGL